MNELVSVIIPVYKVEKYLNRCIESVVKQTYENLEIILVDDGSPDRCPQMCEEWKQKDSRIKVIHKKNGGLSDARNVGLESMTGRYVTFIDSDDYVHPQFIECLYSSIYNYDADIVACEYQEVNADAVVKEMEVIDCKKIQLKQLNEITHVTIAINVWNKMYKKELFDIIRFPVGKIHEDVGIWWELMFYAKKIIAIPQKLYFYCENPDSIMRKEYGMKHMDLVDVFLIQYYKFRERKENDYANQILLTCLDIYPSLYHRIKNGSNLTKEQKKEFCKNYREKILVAHHDAKIKYKRLVKHIIYSRNLEVMDVVYSVKRSKSV